MFDLDLSIFIIVGLLVFLNWVLSKILYKPIMENYRKRVDVFEHDRIETQGNYNATGELVMEMENKLQLAREAAVRREPQVIPEPEEKARHEFEARKAESLEWLNKCRKQNVMFETIVRWQIKSDVKPTAKAICKKIIPLVIFVLMVGFTVVSPASVGASEADSGEHHATTIHGDLEKSVNFLVMVTILMLLAKKPVAKMLSNRSKGITESFKRAGEEKKASLDALSEVSTQRELLPKKIAKIQKLSESRVQDVAQEVRTESQIQIEKMREINKRECLDLQHRIFEKLKDELVELAMGEVYSEVSEGLSIDADRKLVQDCISHLGDISSKGSLSN